jgi:signal peptidase I
MRRKRKLYSFNRNRATAPTKNNFYRRRKTNIDYNIMREVATWAGQILLVIFITAVVVYFFGFRVTVLGQSMAPTLDNGDQVFVDRFFPLILRPRANDLIVYSTGRNEAANFHVKRVIGVPGDTVQIKDGTVYVNDKPFHERGEFPSIETALLAAEPIRVGRNEYFVLGDNRNSSEDSRYAGIGNVSRENIRGRVWLRIAPLRRFGFVR